MSARACPRITRTTAITTASIALTGRGQILWFGVRKRFIADAVDAAIADGASQLLVVGAGFDPLAALVARRHPHVTCVELDAPRPPHQNTAASPTPASSAVRPLLRLAGEPLRQRYFAPLGIPDEPLAPADYLVLAEHPRIN